MKDYIKPTFTLAGLFPVALAVGSDCGVKSGELKDIFENDFGWTYSDKALALGESCEMQFDIDLYCKFTSTDAGALKVLGS